MARALQQPAHMRVALALLVAAIACRSSSGQRQSPTDRNGECTLVENGAGPTGTVPIRVGVVASGLEVPWGLAFVPGGDVLVTERAGRIRRIAEGALVPEPVARVDAVSAAEGGLLGLALHPHFERERWFYIYFTAQTERGARNRVERWRLSADGTRAQRDTIIFDDIPAARFHDGGRIAFGRDGMLYVGTGDATEPSSAQALDSPAGKILRLAPDGDIPADNPFPNSAVYISGVRNVQAFDWRSDGALVIADHGPSGELGRSGHDEVSVARRADNLGWPTIYGCQVREGMVTPSLAWREAVPPGGAAIYTGDAIEQWRGDFIIGSLGARHLHRVRFDGDRVALHEVYLRGEYGRLRTVVMGPDRQLYVTTSNCDGRGECPPHKDQVLRITR